MKINIIQFRDYLESLMWDGVPRIENLLPRFLGAEKNSYTTRRDENAYAGSNIQDI